jgi:hypothetical protein
MEQQEPAAGAPTAYALPAYPTSADSRRQLPPPSTTAATWALGLALVPIPLANIVAIVQAVGVLRRSRDGRDHGRGQAIAALVIAPVWLVVVLAVLAVSVSGAADRDSSGAVVQSGDISVFDLKKGDCLVSAVPEDVDTRTVEVGPCSERHVAEVFAAFDLTDGPYPGRDQVLRLAEGGCARRYDESAAADGDLPETDLSYFYPARETWRTDKGVVCMVGTESTTA